MTAEDILREAAGDLLEQAAEAWAEGCPRLAARFINAAQTLLGRIELEPRETNR